MSAGSAFLDPTAFPHADRRERHSIRTHLLMSLGLSLALVVGVGGWATHTQIAGAVIASG